MTVAAGAAIAAQLAASAPAHATPTAPAPAITIAVTSRFRPVTHDVFVVFQAGPSTSAAVHGTIAGAAAGDVAVLFGQEFPYKKPAVRLVSQRLASGKAAYSFTVTPVLATRYAVRLFANGSPKAPQLATSRALNLYVIGNGLVSTGAVHCAVPTCRVTVKVFSIVPPTTLRTEIAKPIHPYFGLSLGTVTVPPPPKWMILDGGHARVTRALRLSPVKFEHTVSFTFTTGTHSFSWAQFTCFRDSEPRDGLGLPGYHSCGAARVLRTVPYLG